MAKTIFKQVNYTLSTLLSEIQMGYIGLPELQRPFVWPNTRVRDLFDSMYRGYPVGYLLFWQSGADGQFRQIGHDEKQKAPHLLVIDGQQRLTSLYAVLKGVPVLRKDFSQERIYIAFRPTDEAFEVADAAIRKDPEYIPDISVVWNGDVHWHRYQSEYIDRLRKRREVTEDQEAAILDAIDRLKDLTEYPFTALELSPEADEESVADVFVRINSKGITLSQADFILTLMSVYWDDGRKELERFCAASRQPALSGPSPFNRFIQPDPDQMLRVSVALGFRRARLQYVYSILRGKDLETGEVSTRRRNKQFGILKEAQDCVLNLQNWHDFHKALLSAGFRSGGMVTSETTLLYSYALYLIGKRDFGVRSDILRNVIARWFFMAQLTGRYTGSYETQMDQDMARLRGLKTSQEFRAALEHVIENTLTEDFWAIALPNLLATSAAYSPTLSGYNAALNLLNARALLSDVRVPELLDPETKAPKAALERHHLFRRAYLKKQGITEMRAINQIANFAYVEWADNIEISDQPPEKYWPTQVQKRGITSRQLATMMRQHALPKGWEQMAYRDFLERRRKLMANVIRDGFEKMAR